MITVTELVAVWPSHDAYELGQPPVAVCTSEEAAWAVFNLLNPRPNARGTRVGPFPVKDAFYVYSTRPDLAEDSPAAPSAIFRDLSDDYRISQECRREDEAAHQRKMGHYA